MEFIVLSLVDLALKKILVDWRVEKMNRLKTKKRKLCQCHDIDALLQKKLKRM